MKIATLVPLLCALGCSDSTQNDLGTVKDMSMILQDMATGSGDMAQNGLADMTKVPDFAGTTVVTVGPNGALMFDPTTVTISAGSSVTWVWASSGHSVVSGTPGAPDGKFCSPSDTMCMGLPATSLAGDTYTHTFAAAGSYRYFCQPHGSIGMTATVTVQ